MAKNIFYTILIIFSYSFPVFSQTTDVKTEINIESLSVSEKVDYYVHLAEELLSTDRQKATLSALEAIGYADELKEKNRTAKPYLLLADIYLKRNLNDSAMIYASKSLNISEKSENYADLIRAHNIYGRIHLASEKPIEAGASFIKSLNLCQEHLAKDQNDSNLKFLTAEVMNHLVMVYINSGNYPEATDSLQAFSRRFVTSNSYIKMLMLGNLSTLFQMSGERDSALIYANRAYDIALVLDEPENISKILSDIGNIYFSKGEYREALNYFSKGLEILSALDEEAKLAVLYNNMASTYKQLTDYEKATEYFLKSARIKERLQDSTGLSITFNNLALVLMDHGDMKLARAYLGKAVAINTKKKNKRGLSFNYAGLGDFYLRQRLADSSIHFYVESLKIKQELKQRNGMIISLHGLGDVYSELLKDDMKALQLYNQAFTIANEIQSQYESANLQISIGSVLFRQKKYAVSSDYFKLALVYAENEDVPDMIRTCTYYLTKINILAGNSKEASEYYDWNQRAQDSIFSVEKTMAVANIQAKYETEKKDRENEVLTHSNRIKQNQIYYLIGVAIILLVLLIMLLYLYRLKNRAYHQIVLKNLEIVNKEKQLRKISQMLPDSLTDSLHSIGIDQIAKSNPDLIIKLNNLILDEKVFLDSDLTLEKLSKKLNTNRSYLSQIINEHYQDNFNSFINKYRINEARHLLSENKYDHISVEGVGSMVGFSSKVSFYSHFKEIIGVTPAYYRRKAYEQLNKASVS
jgi:YesN/AraC family two-component response regulator